MFDWMGARPGGMSKRIAEKFKSGYMGAYGLCSVVFALGCCFFLELRASLNHSVFFFKL